MRWTPQSTITEALDHVLEVDPEREAVRALSGHLTYGELEARANASAAVLRELGVRPGDRVAACLPNDLDIVVAFHGAMRLGAIWVGVNRTLAPPEMRTLLGAATPSVLLADPGVADELDVAITIVRVDPQDERADWQSALATTAGAARPPLPNVEAPAGIAFTSGTTGLPKGIVHSQRNLLLPAASIVASRGYDETLRKGDCLSLTILNMQVLTTLLTSNAGGCCVLTDRRDGRGVAEWIARESVTVWNGVPAQLYSMVHDDELDPELLAGLREAWAGGSACPEEIVSGFEARFGAPLRTVYGLTEAPTVVTIDPVDGPHVEGGSGLPLPHLDVRICDDDGRALPTGAEGEVVIGPVADGPWACAYTTLLGQWRADGGVDPHPSDDLRTGDLGTIDGDGHLHIRDRKKLLIIRGGANVYPAEVERVLERVAGVRASAVLGLPDERLGQRVVAAIEVESDFAGVDPLLQHCQAELARYKVPEKVVVVDELPRNAMGKVQRTELLSLFEHS